MHRYKHKHICRAVAVLAGVAVGLVLVELGLRLLGLRYGATGLVSDPILHHAPMRNYTFTKYDPSGDYGGHLVRYDAEGLVAPAAPSAAAPCPAPKYRVAFMGDSFVAATEVPYEESFVGRLAERARRHAVVKNYGVSSYSPIFYLLQWRTKVRRFKPTHVFVLLYSNDIAGDRRMVRQALRGEDGRIVAIPGPKEGWWRIQMRKAYVYQLLAKHRTLLEYWLKHQNYWVVENPDVSELSAGLVLNLAREVKATGARFVLMAVPSKFRLTTGYADPKEPEFSDKWRLWAAKNAVEFLDLVPRFQEAQREGQKLFFHRDIHFSPAGHKVVADAIAAAYPGVFPP